MRILFSMALLVAYAVLGAALGAVWLIVKLDE